MSDLATFFRLGLHHILDPGAADHLLFLLVLAAVYRPAEWRRGIRVVTAFTVGHSLTLALAVTGAMVLPARLVEFLIPLTIVATGVLNLAALRRRVALGAPLAAATFGLIHGAGFAGYLRALFLDRIAVPLLGFNLGIEAAQIVVLLAAGAGLAVLDRGLAEVHAARTPPAAHRLRVALVSLTGIALAAGMAIQRRPW